MDFGEFIRSKGYYEVRIYSGHYVGRKPRLNIQVPGDKNRKFHLIREEIVSLGRGILMLANSPQPFPH